MPPLRRARLAPKLVNTACQWLLRAARRGSALCLGAALLGYLIVTLFPYRFVNPFAESGFRVLSDGSYRFTTPSLFRSARGTAVLDSPAFVDAKFSVGFVARSEQFGQRESSRFISYSLNEETPVWMISQMGEDLYVKHRGRGAFIRNIIKPGEPHHYVVAMAGARLTVYVDGKLHVDRPFAGTSRAWHTAHLSIANEITGDRPLVGTLGRLRLFPETLSAAQAERLAKDEDPGVQGYVLQSDVARQKLWLAPNHPGASIELERVPWPFKHKWELSPEPSSSRLRVLLDAILNVILTLPIGFFLVMTLGSQGRSRWLVVVVGVLQCGLAMLVEAGQFFLIETRDPNVLDVITNTLGAVLGSILGIRFSAMMRESPARFAPLEPQA